MNLPYDRNLYQNDRAALFCEYLPETATKKAKVQSSNGNGVVRHEECTEAELREIEILVEMLEEREIDIVSSYDRWLKVAFAFAGYGGEKLRPLFHRLSAINESAYSAKEADKIYTECLKANERNAGKFEGVEGAANGPATIGTFYHLAEEAGAKIGRCRISTHAPTDQEGSVEDADTNNIIDIGALEQEIDELPKGHNDFSALLTSINHVASNTSRDGLLERIVKRTGCKKSTLKKDIIAIQGVAVSQMFDADNPYIVDGGYVFKAVINKENEIDYIKISNFQPRILEQIEDDDGLSTTILYKVGGTLKSKVNLPVLEVTAADFEKTPWWVAWGYEPILEPRKGYELILIHYAKTMSTPKKTKRFSHTGWTEINGEHCYITSAGAIGSTADNVDISLKGILSKYSVPLVPENEKAAIEASLDFLDIGKPEITHPLYVYGFMSVLTSVFSKPPTYCIYSYGDSGVFKSSINALMLSHWGEFNNIEGFSSFEDTQNSILARGSLLKDTLHLVDDLCPSPQKNENDRKAKMAQALVRGHGNRTPRSRLQKDCKEMKESPPLGGLCITGEELLKGVSTLARIFIIDLKRGDIFIDKLSELQGKAVLLPHAMSSFVLWVAKNMYKVKGIYSERFEVLRAEAAGRKHYRHPEQMAFFTITLEIMDEWIKERHNEMAGRIATATDTLKKCLSDNVTKQELRIAEENPINVFIDIFRTCQAQGTIKLVPKSAQSSFFDDGHADANPQAVNCRLVGYYDDLHDYLLGGAMWEVVKEKERDFPISRHTLWTRLIEDEKILPGEARNDILLRLGTGRMQRVLRFKKGVLYEDAPLIQKDRAADLDRKGEHMLKEAAEMLEESERLKSVERK